MFICVERIKFGGAAESGTRYNDSLGLPIAQQPVILAMRPNPNPRNFVVVNYADGSTLDVNSD